MNFHKLIADFALISIASDFIANAVVQKQQQQQQAVVAPTATTISDNTKTVWSEMNKARWSSMSEEDKQAYKLMIAGRD
jgi:hypothetical protein